VIYALCLVLNMLAESNEDFMAVLLNCSICE